MLKSLKKLDKVCLKLPNSPQIIYTLNFYGCLQPKFRKSHEKFTIIYTELVGEDYLNLIPILRYTLSIGKACPASDSGAGTTHIQLCPLWRDTHHLA